MQLLFMGVFCLEVGRRRLWFSRRAAVLQAKVVLAAVVNWMVCGWKGGQRKLDGAVTLLLGMGDGHLRR